MTKAVLCLLTTATQTHILIKSITCTTKYNILPVIRCHSVIEVYILKVAKIFGVGIDTPG